MDDGISLHEFRRRREDEHSTEESSDMREGGSRPSLLVYLLVIACVAVCIAAAVYLFLSSTRYEYTARWTRSTDNPDGTIDTFRGYKSFAGGIIKYTRDGAEYIDKKGEVVWERSYEMDAPVIDVSADYAVIADQGSADIYFFSAAGLTGQSETLLPISLVRISDGGVCYAVLNDSEAEYITAFRADGSSIDLSVKSVVYGEGYPFDMDVSPDGTQLVTSYVGIENGALCNNVVFRNFGQVGQNEDSRRIVGGFSEEFEGHIAGRVHFSDEEYSQAFYDGGIVFFSTRVLNTPEVLANITFEERMTAIAPGEDFTAVLLENEGPPSDSTDQEDGEAARYTLEIYDPRGSRTGEAGIYTGFKGMSVSGASVIVYDSSNITVYSAGGRKRAEFHLEDTEIVEAAGSGETRSFYIITATDITRASF